MCYEMYCCSHYSVRTVMTYSDLIDSGASTTEIRSYLRDSELVSVTIRIPRTLRDSAKEAASLSGINFTSFIRSCMIDRLSKVE